MKTLFMFPGQGAQQVGMGKEIAGQIPQIAQLYERAGDIVGYDLADICFNGPEEKLNTTEISQPAIFVTSVALLMALQEGKINTQAQLHDIEPDACAGLSLGEYTALYAAGAMKFDDALKLVQLRGRCMQKAADETQGTMVSLLGMDEEGANKLCEAVLAEEITENNGAKPLIVPVNFNCPGQIVLSGTIQAAKRAAELAPEYGASRAIPLQVAGAFHTPLMDGAAEKLDQALSNCQFSPFKCPVLANVDACQYDSLDVIKEKLLKQLVSAVRWQQLVESLLGDGFGRFVEIGPGRVLTGLVKKTARVAKKKVEIVTINGK